jgi:valyl-tRNA synthetase
MPFISEELWNELGERKTGDYLIVAKWPTPGDVDSNLLKESETAFDVITQIRNVRASKGLSPKEALNVHQAGQMKMDNFWSIIKKLANVGNIAMSGAKPVGTSFLSGTTEFTVQLEGKIDVEKEKESILKDIEYQKGFLSSVEKKLGNEKFVSGAPANVIDNERRKKADAEAKIKALEERLTSL